MSSNKGSVVVSNPKTPMLGSMKKQKRQFRIFIIKFPSMEKLEKVLRFEWNFLISLCLSLFSNGRVFESSVRKSDSERDSSRIVVVVHLLLLSLPPPWWSRSTEIYSLNKKTKRPWSRLRVPGYTCTWHFLLTELMTVRSQIQWLKTIWIDLQS